MNRRVRQKWSRVVESSDTDLETFIRRRANVGPFDEIDVDLAERKV